MCPTASAPISTVPYRPQTRRSWCFPGGQWPDKATGDAGWAALMADPRMAADNLPMPFDGKRRVYGGFASLLRVNRTAAG